MSATTSGYYQDAEDWHDDKISSATVDKRRWMVVGVIGLLIGTLSIISFLVGAFKKEYVPIVVERNAQTGAITILKDQNVVIEDLQEAIDKHFAAKYVLARETWDAADLKQQYHLVKLFSSTQVMKDYDFFVSMDNEDGPAHKLGREDIREIEIHNITFIDDQVAQVRFTAEINRKHTPPESEVGLVATLAFIYVPDATITAADRLTNFAHFMVTRYRVDQDM